MKVVTPSESPERKKYQDKSTQDNDSSVTERREEKKTVVSTRTIVSASEAVEDKAASVVSEDMALLEAKLQTIDGSAHSAGSTLRYANTINLQNFFKFKMRILSQNYRQPATNIRNTKYQFLWGSFLDELQASRKVIKVRGAIALDLAKILGD